MGIFWWSITYGIKIGVRSRGAAFFGVFTIACITLMALPSGSAAQGPSALTQILNNGIIVSYPEGWSAAPYADTYQLLNVPAAKQATLDVATLAKTAQIIITTERGREHAEAIRRLKEIAAEVDSPSTFLNIGSRPRLPAMTASVHWQPGFRCGAGWWVQLNKGTGSATAIEKDIEI